METRIYKDGSKTGKTTKLIIALIGIGGIVGASAYGLMELNIPFLPLQTFTIVGVFLIGFFTFGEIKGIPMWRFFYLAMRYSVSENKRKFVLESEEEDVVKVKKQKTKKFRFKKAKEEK